LIDSGIPYNPLEKEDPDITQKLEDRAIGGMGIFLTKQYMDNISYNYTDGKNKITIQKKL
jgi:anti-sigma regulatory factor (Ser/Thr protein kinase)